MKTLSEIPIWVKTHKRRPNDVCTRSSSQRHVVYRAAFDSNQKALYKLGSTAVLRTGPHKSNISYLVLISRLSSSPTAMAMR